ncbi:MAG: radical SAM protein [Fibrobacteres bacterium]|nr:radical SAM protein [Fibrobacterota bacterium]
MNNNYSLIPKLFASSPLRSLRLASNMLSIFKARHLDYNIYKGATRELALVTLKITPLCNLRCVMCGQRGVTGTLKAETAQKEKDSILAPSVYKNMIDAMGHKKPIIYVWGGEPLMYPGFLDLADYLNERSAVFAVNTNGTLLEEHAERIVKARWTSLFISLDSFREENDAIRGEGSYDKVMRAITAINREKEKQNSLFPQVGIVSTVNSINYKNLDKLVEACKGYKLSWHIINLGTYFSEKIGCKHSDFMKENFDVDTHYWKGFANGYNEGIDGAVLSKILEKIHSVKPGYPILTVPVINPAHIGDYYSKLDLVVRDRCTCPWSALNVNYNGDVHFCADYPDYILGNIKNDTLPNIMNGVKAKRFRNALKNSPNGLFPGCVRCYQNMLAGRRRL